MGGLAIREVVWERSVDVKGARVGELCLLMGLVGNGL